jgi:hypothetical protein
MQPGPGLNGKPSLQRRWWLHRLGKFLTLLPPDRHCLVEAAFWLGLARLAILILPFRRIAPLLGRNPAQSPAATAAPRELLARISWAVNTASRHLPWECLCLVQALAAKAMLKRRKVASTLYLGLAKDPDTQLKAHAWLRCGDRILTGEQGVNNFTIIAAFAEDEP